MILEHVRKFPEFFLGVEKKSEHSFEAENRDLSIAHGFRAIRATPRECRRVECVGEVFCRKCPDPVATPLRTIIWRGFLIDVPEGGGAECFWWPVLNRSCDLLHSKSIRKRNKNPLFWHNFQHFCFTGSKKMLMLHDFSDIVYYCWKIM